MITGVTGQDGSYLAEFLIRKGYEVHGLIRRSSLINTSRVDHLYTDPHEQSGGLKLHFADLTDSSRMIALISQIQPDEIYNLGAQSHVRVSFDEPEVTAESTGLGVLRILEAIRMLQIPTKFYQASSSEMFGATNPPQSELSNFHPRSPYGVSKVYGYWITRNYRESYGIHASNGILFNHESPRRGETFVTRKITMAAAAISLGLQKKLYLGNINAIRDWGFAPEYVEAMWLMLQQQNPDDYVVATGVACSVRDFLQSSFSELGLDWEKYVDFDKRYERPAEVDALIGDATKAKESLGWGFKTDSDQLAKIMVRADLDLLINPGKKISDSLHNYWG